MSYYFWLGREAEETALGDIGKMIGSFWERELARPGFYKRIVGLGSNQGA